MEKRKRGRPPKGRVKRSVSLTLAAWSIVVELSRSDGMSISDAVSCIVSEWHKRRRPPAEMSSEDLEAFRIAQAAAIKAGLPGINTGDPIKHEHLKWEEDDDAS